MSGPKCMDCGVDTGKIREMYMVRRTLWRAVVPDGRGFLCVGCLEERIGRRLDAYDFDALALNLGSRGKSERLRDRLGDFDERLGQAAMRAIQEIGIFNGRQLAARRKRLP